MATVLCVIGTRPEAIKLAPVIQELERRPQWCRARVCITGQHRQMLDPVRELFQLRIDCDLDVMRPNQSLASLTARLLEGLEACVRRERPDWILAQGDTTSVLAAALVAYYERIRFAHVEAGLRTGNKWRPFPEEINRTIADRLADLYFAPTNHNRQALLLEGCPAEKIVVTGNTVVDALQAIAQLPYSWQAGPLAMLPDSGKLVLITAHRRESFGEGMAEICAAIRQLAEAFAADPAVRFVFPVHLNPQVQQPVTASLAGLRNIQLLPPLDYQSQVQLMRRCALILTDSGGIQEEAPSLGVPVLVLREETERPEGIEAGVARLVGTDRCQIFEAASNLLRDEAARRAMIRPVSPYGDGQAARRIVAALMEFPGPTQNS